MSHLVSIVEISVHNQASKQANKQTNSEKISRSALLKRLRKFSFSFRQNRIPSFHVIYLTYQYVWQFFLWVGTLKVKRFFEDKRMHMLTANLYNNLRVICSNKYKIAFPSLWFTDQKNTAYQLHDSLSNKGLSMTVAQAVYYSENTSYCYPYVYYCNGTSQFI